MDVKKNYINGEWVSTTSGKTIEVINPANGEVIALVSESSVEDTRKAIAAAKESFYVTREPDGSRSEQYKEDWPGARRQITKYNLC